MQLYLYTFKFYIFVNVKLEWIGLSQILISRIINVFERIKLINTYYITEKFSVSNPVLYVKPLVIGNKRLCIGTNCVQGSICSNSYD